MTTTATPLDGLVVADFSRVLAGPYASMFLADLGADVIKVEGPAGDETRGWKPPARGETSSYYLAINRGKRSIKLDLTDADDLDVARRLVERADVLLENMKPGTMAKFGLDYESVREQNPGLIYTSITGFGDRAGRRLLGYDLVIQGVSGLMSLTGSADGPAYRSGISVFDIMVGNHALVGILAALHQRATTGSGQWVRVNLLSSALYGLVNHSAAYVAADTVPYRMGNAHPSLFPYEPLPTGDGELIIVAANDLQFRRLCEVLGLPSLTDDARFATAADRTKHRDELRPILVERLAERGAQEWFALLTEAGVACGPINTIDQGFALATELGLDPVVEVGPPERAVPSVRNPIDFSNSTHAYELPPPEFDEHGADVREWLTKASDDA